MTLPSLTLLSGSTQTAPWTCGHAFKQGEVPAGQSVACAGAASFQVVHKNTWPDGSLKFAVLSGTAALTASTPLALPLSLGTAASGALTITQLKATGITASIDAGAFGSASWSGTDWDSPAQTWVSGPVMSSWTYRKPIGSDAHLVGWLEVRLYAGGQVEVLPWIENGYINVAAPSNKSATYQFTLGGTARLGAGVAIDLKHHQRTPLISGTALSYWLGADPDVTPLPDPAYLQETELVPTYSGQPAVGSGPVLRASTSYAPLQEGGFVFDNGGMPGGGYQRPIGLLPEHDVVYLTGPSSARASLSASVQRNGYSAGRYGIHYRDESTYRPLRFSQWPNMVISDSQGFSSNGSSTTNQRTPTATGGGPPSWDTAHSPSVGYMAYLLTGRLYHLEEVQFGATVNYLGNGNNSVLRNGAQGLVQPAFGAWQTRAAAWMWRTLTQALAVTPDGDVLQTEFKNSVQANIDHFHARYVAQPNNHFGCILNDTSGYVSGTYGALGPWQQDFVGAAFGYSRCLGLPLDTGYAAKLSAFHAWQAQSIVGRLSAVGAGGWPYINGDPYVISISTAAVPNWVDGTGPWRADWAEVYSVAAATLTAASAYPTAWLGSTDGVLCGEIMPGAKAMWGNLTPALSYAVRHGVSGAAEARSRVTGATNYSALATEFDSEPVWSVAPAVIPTGATGMGDTLRIDTTDAGKLVIGDVGHGILGSVIRATTATGTHGPGILYNDWDDASDDNREFRALVLSGAPAGTFVYEDGSFSVPAGTADGSYVVTYRLYVDGVPQQATTTATINVGVTPFAVTATGRASTAAVGTATFAFVSTAFSVSAAGLPSSVVIGTPSASFSAISTFAVTATSRPSTLSIGSAALAFDIPDNGEPVTLSEAKLAARVDSDDLDPLILSLLIAAREQAEHITGRVYRRATHRIERVDWPAATDALPVYEATAAAIGYWDGATWQTLAPSAYLFAPGGVGDNGTVIAPAAGQAWPDLGERPVGARVRVDLTAGPASRDLVPAQVKLYVLATVTAWLKTPEALAAGTIAAHQLYERLLDAERVYR